MERLTDKVLELGLLTLQFGRTYRATFHEDGVTPESDTDHSVMLALTAGALADKYVPRLDRGRVVEFAVLHDLVEVYAGDVATFNELSAEEKGKKKENEHKAFLRIQEKFGEDMPWIHKTIAEYERFDTPEARFVKVLDRIIASVTHILNKGATLKGWGTTPEEVEAWHEKSKEWGKEQLEEFPELEPFWNDMLKKAYEINKNI